MGGLFEASEGDLGKKNQVLREITMLSCEHWTLVQLSSKSIFT